MELIIEEKPLSPVEQSRLGELEAIVRENLKAWYAVGTAMIEIRESRLYRNDAGRTWEGYCREMFDMSHQHADRQISAAKVIENLTPIGVKEDGTVDWELLPANEAQARELSRLAPEEQVQVWGGLVDSKRLVEATNVPVKLTAKAVKNAVKAMKGEQISRTIKKAGDEVKNAVKPDKNKQSAEFAQAWEILLEQIEEERRFEWKNTPRPVVFSALATLAKAVGECGEQTMREKKITFRANNVEKLLAAGFGIFRRQVAVAVIEKMENPGEWVTYGEYDSMEIAEESFRDLMLEANNIQA